MLRTSFILYAEPFNAPIIRTQVLSLLGAIGRSGYPVTLVAFQPVHRLLTHRALLREARTALARDRVALSIIPLPLFPRISRPETPSWWSHVLLTGYLALVACLIPGLNRGTVVHCRSYPVTRALLLARRLRGYRLIFDPRSPYVDETIGAGLWPPGSLTARYWRRTERHYLRHADRIVVTTPALATLYRERAGRDLPCVVIPNNVTIPEDDRLHAARPALRQRLGIPPDATVYAYAGSLDGKWNDPHAYVTFADIIAHRDPAAHLLVLTRNTAPVAALLATTPSLHGRHHVLAVAPDQTVEHLALADFGLNLMKRPDARLSIKTVEYLAAGLTLIVNEHVQGAAALVREYDAGVVLPPQGAPPAPLERRDPARQRELARRLFSTTTAAAACVALYHDFESDAPEAAA